MRNTGDAWCMPVNQPTDEALSEKPSINDDFLSFGLTSGWFRARSGCHPGCEASRGTQCSAAAACRPVRAAAAPKLEASAS
eukprot:m.269087 g.269087  ORF g.269087 m.269087 type:complete len:81 (+) comp16064_c0_seq11:2671-2913(+)